MTDLFANASALEATVAVVLVLLAGGILLAVVRLLMGPTLPDRVVAIDLIATQSVAMLASAAIAFNEPALLQPALVLTLIAFVGTVAFARYVAKRATP
jgi:multicomponent Na+:H+ antiporter subunit F